MSHKSKLACDFSIASLMEGHETCYLWTFTLPDKLAPRDAAWLWNQVQRKLVREAHMVGVRVFEIHPGGHGLHVHLVTPFWYWVDDIRRITSRYRWGRINVKPIPSVASGYVSKYIGKQTTKDFPELKGLRLWAKIGTKLTQWKGARVADMYLESMTHSLFRDLYNRATKEQTDSFRFVMKLWKICRFVVSGICDFQYKETSGGLVVWSWAVHPVTGAKLRSALSYTLT